MADENAGRGHDKQVHIHIDDKPYESPTPTTGAALYALGHVAEGLVLFRDIPGKEDDDEVPNTNDEIGLHNGDHFRTGEPGHKEITIIVNARRKTVTKKHLTFDEVVALAFDPVPTGPNIMFTITYRNGPRPNPEGTMLEGAVVKIQDGMIFNVTATDKS